jgi:hypothetical protein
MMRPLLCLVLLVVTGCSGSERFARPAPSPAAVPAAPAAGFAWARSDGQRIAGNPELTERAQADIAACQAETPPRAASGVPGEACMRSRGYYVRSI